MATPDGRDIPAITSRRCGVAAPRFRTTVLADDRSFSRISPCVYTPRPRLTPCRPSWLRWTAW
jgi:hypothetical protein